MMPLGKDDRVAEWEEYRYRVIGTAPVTPVIRELLLEPAGPAIGYRPGQYVLLSDTRFAIPQRSYSLAGAPRPDGRISLLVTRVPGGPTSMWAHGLSIYDEVSVEGPFGTFLPNPGAAGPVLLLGAGSGLAPLRAIAEALAGPDSGAARRPVTLLFSGRRRRDLIDRARFEGWAATDAQFQYRYTTTRETGPGRHTRLPAALPQEFDSLRGFEVFACGPSGFVTGCEAAARALGASAVHTEEFFTDPAPWIGDMPPLPGADIALHQEVT